jgi:hypothetical protein
MKAYRHFIKYALAKGCTVSVWDGEEWQVLRSNKLKAITDAVESVEEAALRIHGATGETLVNNITVSAFGLEDDETIIDHTVCPFMDAYDTATN